jgi:hypothetical protein
MADPMGRGRQLVAVLPALSAGLGLALAGGTLNSPTSQHIGAGKLGHEQAR